MFINLQKKIHMATKLPLFRGFKVKENFWFIIHWCFNLSKLDQDHHVLTDPSQNSYMYILKVCVKLQCC